MQNFTKLIDYLESNPEYLEVRGDKKKIKAMVKLTSVNYDGSPYFKMIFEDDGYLLMIVEDQEIYYAPEYEAKVDIPDKEVGKEEIKFKDKTYKLDNPNDYQYVLQFYRGTILDIEGEIKFFDYMPIEGPKEFLSLGWSMRTGERSDLNPIEISLPEVEIPK